LSVRGWLSPNPGESLTELKWHHQPAKQNVGLGWDLDSRTLGFIFEFLRQSCSLMEFILPS